MATRKTAKLDWAHTEEIGFKSTLLSETDERLGSNIITQSNRIAKNPISKPSSQKPGTPNSGDTTALRKLFTASGYDEWGDHVQRQKFRTDVDAVYKSEITLDCKRTWSSHSDNERQAYVAKFSTLLPTRYFLIPFPQRIYEGF